jgi:transporter family protein
VSPLGVGAALITAFLWALTAMLVRLDTGRLSALAVNAYRVTIGAIPFLLIFVLTREPASLLAQPAMTLLTLTASVLLAMVGGATLNFIAIQRIGLARAFPISSAYPLGTVLLSGPILHEPIGWQQGVGAVVTLAGVTLVALPAKAEAAVPLDRRAATIGLLLAVGAAVMWALASIVTKLAITGLDLLTASAIRLPVAALVLWLLVLAQEGWPLRIPPWRLTRRVWLVLAGAGLLGPGLGAYLWMLAMTEIGAARTDVITATAPIFAMLLAIIVLRETVSRRAAIGTLLSVAGIALVL